MYTSRSCKNSKGIELMLRKLDIHLRDSLRFSGDIIDFRCGDMTNAMDLKSVIRDSEKKIYAIDTFTGLPAISPMDMKNPDKNEVKTGQFEYNKSIGIRRISGTSNIFMLKTSNYNDLSSLMSKEQEFCFALVDQKQYEPTERVLDYIWERISYGGTIYIHNYLSGNNHSSHAAVKKFLDQKADQIQYSRQMMVDGVKERFIAIKCFNQKKKPLTGDTRKEKVTIALVLKTGGPIYDFKYVNNLARAIKKNTTVDHEIVCLTNDTNGIDMSVVDRTIALTNGYPTWWNKIELFKRGQFNTNQVFYLDLDTFVIGNIDEIITYRTSFSGLRDFYSLHSLGSGILSWMPEHHYSVYEEFVKRSDHVISTYREGDQKWIDEQVPQIDYIQDLFPNKIVSYKRHCVADSGEVSIPPATKILCFHGNPRPHTVRAPEVSKYWTE